MDYHIRRILYGKAFLLFMFSVILVFYDFVSYNDLLEEMNKCLHKNKNMLFSTRTVRSLDPLKNHFTLSDSVL